MKRLTPNALSTIVLVLCFVAVAGVATYAMEEDRKAHEIWLNETAYTWRETTQTWTGIHAAVGVDVIFIIAQNETDYYIFEFDRNDDSYEIKMGNQTNWFTVAEELGYNHTNGGKDIVNKYYWVWYV